MRKTDIQGSIQEAAALIRKSKYMIAFTGAGISVESGVPSFRGEGGVWGSYDERHLELGFFLREPEIAWKTIRELFYKFTLDVKPNRAHEILASWEKQGMLKLVITQNIDGLHTRAGTEKLAEFHGSCNSLVCLRCSRSYRAEKELLDAMPPRCSCGGILKPDFVFFGEGIPEKPYSLSFDASNKADLCLVIGSTGLVYPAAAIPGTVKARGGKVIEINPEPSEFSGRISDVFIPLGASKAMEAMDKELRE
ncbi:NAD-dependent protein deacetylase [Spirochaetota bacterium]